MTKAQFEKVYNQFIDGSILVNHVKMRDKFITIYYKDSTLTIDYFNIKSIQVYKLFNVNINPSKYIETLRILFITDDCFSLEVESAL